VVELEDVDNEEEEEMAAAAAAAAARVIAAADTEAAPIDPIDFVDEAELETGGDAMVRIGAGSYLIDDKGVEGG